MDCQTETQEELSQTSEEALSRLCKALGHPARLRLLSILIKDGSCISGDLAEQMPLAPSTISEHLRILKEAGLVKGTIDGPKRCYCVNKDMLKRFKALVRML